MPDFTIPVIIIFMLFLVIFFLYKLGLAVVAGIEILRGKR